MPGALVAARGRRWRVASAVDHADCREVHLRGFDGEARVLLWPFDRLAPVVTRERFVALPLPRWLRRVRRLAVDAEDAWTPRARFSGDVLPYQLAPAVAIASGVRRVLLADEVGLGKTIQAGWIVADLLTREPGARVLVAVPASLGDQWTSELSERFALQVQRVDARWLRGSVASRPADVSPWAAPGVYLGSIDFLKRRDVTSSVASRPWDLLIVDEAHAATAPTERHAALARIASVSRCVVLISATPYAGDPAAFASMIALGSLGDAGPVLFRRSRADVGDTRARRHRFALVRLSSADARLQRLLEQYTRSVWTSAPADMDAARLAMTVLRKRALSSPAAALRSLSRRLELLVEPSPAPRQMSLFDEEADADDELPEAAMATPGLADASLERRWLQTLVDAAEAAAAHDSKLRHLLRLVARAAPEPIVIFTEYRDTLRRLAAALPGALHLHGGLAAHERSAVQRRFNEHGGVLLATDAAADGLNLQRRCRLLVNYELPWNPARLEQRIGRVDRIGQRRRVHAISFVARDTAEDLVVARLARRLARVSATFGERDRLASFLSDARMARAVIGGEAAEAPEAAAAVPPLPRADPSEGELQRIAGLVARRSTVGALGPVLVARVRSAHLDPGAVVIVRAAVTHDAACVATRTIALHLGDLVVPRSAGARFAEFAAQAARVAEAAAGSLPDVAGWFASVEDRQRHAIASQMRREEALRDGAPALRPLQPGLFDRRALDERQRDAAAASACRDEHDARLRQLAGGLDLRLECRATAVLQIWR